MADADWLKAMETPNSSVGDTTVTDLRAQLAASQAEVERLTKSNGEYQRAYETACDDAHEAEASLATLRAEKERMEGALRSVHALVAEAANTGFNWKDGDWAERLFRSQQATHAALTKETE